MCIRVNKCCCGCCTLQTGTKIIGSLTLIGGLIRIIQNVTTMILSGGFASLVAVSVFVPEIVIAVIWITVTIPLLIAASKNRRPKLLLPWLIISVLATLLVTGFGLYMSITLMLSPDPTVGIIFIVVILIGTAFSIYFWIIIYSYRKQLIEVKTQQNRANNIPML